MLETVKFLTQRGIPVMGHVGLTPQAVHQLGYRKQGKTEDAAEQIYQQAIGPTAAKEVFCLCRIKALSLWHAFTPQTSLC